MVIRASSVVPQIRQESFPTVEAMTPSLVLLLVLWTSPTEASRILGLWPMPSYSHYTVGHKLLKELSTRGHHITMISPFKSEENRENYRNIHLENMQSTIQEKFGVEFDFFQLEALKSYEEDVMYYHLGMTFTQVLLQNGQVQDLIHGNESFDLVMVDAIYTEALWGFGYLYQCPVIVVSALDGSHLFNYLVANPAPNSFVPCLYLPFSGEMNLWERFQNARHSLIMQLHRYLYQLPEMNQQLHEFFPRAPELEELLYSRTSLILLNTHPSFLEPKPQVPSVIEVGGIHLDEPKKLPQDLQQFMDNATDGVIFFGMGSTLKSRNLSNTTRRTILRALAKLKQQIIWKWEDEELPGQPANVKIMKWAPQNDILAHPNLKLFITHGGLLSVTEAVNFGIPILGLPIFADQKMNMAIATRKQYGLGIYQQDLTENTLSAALRELLENPKYRDNVQLRSELFRDRPVRPIDTAVYWTEYVIRYKGAAHLRTAAMELQWYQLYSIDVAVFLLVTAISVFFVFHQIIKRISTKLKIEYKKKNN